MEKFGNGEKVIYTSLRIFGIWGEFFALGGKIQLSPGAQTFECPYSGYSRRSLWSPNVQENSWELNYRVRSLSWCSHFLVIWTLLFCSQAGQLSCTWASEDRKLYLRGSICTCSRLQGCQWELAMLIWNFHIDRFFVKLTRRAFPV